MTAFEYIESLFVSQVLGQAVICIRGAPGSGKTTLAQKLEKKVFDEVILAAADDFFQGEYDYEYNPKFIGTAHQYAVSKMNYALYHKHPLIVHNTSTQFWELDTIFNLVDTHRVPLVIIDLHTQYGNVHGVPDEKVVQMQERFVPCTNLRLPIGFEESHFMEEKDFRALLLTPKPVQSKSPQDNTIPF